MDNHLVILTQLDEHRSNDRVGSHVSATRWVNVFPILRPLAKQIMRSEAMSGSFAESFAAGLSYREPTDKEVHAWLMRLYPPAQEL